MIILETDRLLLRQFTANDHANLMHVFGDPEVMRFGDGPQSEEWVRAWLKRCIENYARGRAIGPWAVVERTSNAVIGYCGLFHFPDVCGSPETELGYRLARNAWGKGFATEACRAVRDHAFNVLGVSRLVSIIDPANSASIRVADKVGMRYEKEVMFDGYTHPDHVYAISVNSNVNVWNES